MSRNRIVEGEGRKGGRVAGLVQRFFLVTKDLQFIVSFYSVYKCLQYNQEVYNLNSSFSNFLFIFPLLLFLILFFLLLTAQILIFLT